MNRNGPGQTPHTQFRQELNFIPRIDHTLEAHQDYVTQFTVLPGGILASGAWDSAICLWNTNTGDYLGFLEGHTAEIQFVIALPDGRLASGSQDRTLRFWQVSTQHCYAVHKSSTWVSHFAMLPDGRLATNDGTKIRLWDTRTGNCVATLEGGHTKYLNDIVVLSDGRLATTSNDDWTNKICLWDLRTGKCTSTIQTNAYGLVALPNNRLASRYLDEKIRLWDTHTGRNLAVMEGAGHVFSLVALPDGRLASGSQCEGAIRLWDPNIGRCVATLEGHTKAVSDLVALPDGRLASYSWDKTIRLWDLRSKQCLSILENVGGGLAALPDGRLVSSGNSENKDYSVRIWDVGLRSVVTARAQSQPRAVLVKAEADRATISAPTAKAIEKVSSVFSDMKLSSTNLGIIPFADLNIQCELGRGGFGVVCEAFWQGTQVAVKQLIGQLTSELLAEFRGEAVIHARLRHPNIIVLYGICVEATKYALVMEFMASGSLFDVLKNPADLPWSVRLAISLDVVSGLLYLHTQNIIHRDLKSFNILIDDRMRAKIADFGLAKIKLSTASMTKGGGGTPHWMAPELFDETINSPATDVYATGIILWEIAARKLPYEGKNASQIMRTVEKGNRETMPVGTPPPFGMLISRCWAQRAEDRPSIEVVARDIREIQARLPSNASSAKASVDSGYAAFSRR